MFEELPHAVPVFPLPDVVVFPHAAVPLHVYELRYRTMVRDALSSRREIALATLRPGWERDYQGSPEFHPLGCLARIEEIEWLPNDCYDLKLSGVARVRFTRVVREYPYRVCRAVRLPQHPVPEDDPIVTIEKQALRETHARIVQALGGGETIPPAAVSALSLEGLTNLLCMMVAMPAEEKLALLALDSVLDRSKRIRACAELALKARRRRPPEPGGGDRN